MVFGKRRAIGKQQLASFVLVQAEIEGDILDGANRIATIVIDRIPIAWLRLWGSMLG